MKKFNIAFFLIYFSIFSYSQVSPSYYSTLNGKQSAALKTELHNILMADTSRYYSYGSGANHTWNGFYITDRDTINNLVVDMYSDSLRYFSTNYISLGYPGFGSAIQIEHSLPKSWWGDHTWAAYKDLNHIYPSDGSTNQSKNDNPLGVVSGTPTKDNGVSKIGPANYPDYSGNVFEPADKYKGDFARSYFYMATAYEHYKNLWDTTKPENMMQNNTYPVFKTWAINLLLQWSRQDPVSLKERTRNEKVYSIQGNRNPFIDYPELAEYIWGNKVGTTWSMTTSIQNPLSNEFEIKFNSTNSCFTVISKTNVPIAYAIYTINGQKVVQDKSFTNFKTQIPTLNQGIYLIEINSLNNSFNQVFKFVYK
jgi:endonuclease I